MTTLGVAPNLLNSVGPWRRLPLLPDKSRALTFQGPGLFTVYVPSRYGGKLVVGSDRAEAKILVRHPKPDSPPLKDLAGKDIPAGNPFVYHAAESEFQWFHVFVAPLEGDYKMWAMFHEIGLAREDKNLDADPLIPWNFWYFPYADSMAQASAWGSAIFTPCQKYEQVYGKNDVLAWEKQHHNDPNKNKQGWEGHCHNAAPASMVFEEPPHEGIEHAGTEFLCEELKFLATEFAGTYIEKAGVWKLPGHGPQGRQGDHQEKKPAQDPKLFGSVVGAFHNALRDSLRKEMIPVMMDLRDKQGLHHPSVWNQAVYMYEAVMYETLAENDPRDVSVGTVLLANEDCLNPQDATIPTGLPAVVRADGPRPQGRPKSAVRNKTGRDQFLRYRLIFRDDGTIDVNDPRNRWSSVIVADAPKVELHAPRFMVSAKKAAPNPLPGHKANPKFVRSEVLELVKLRQRYQ